MAKALEREEDAIGRLRALADAPHEQLEYAVRLVKTARHPNVMQAALDVLAESGNQRARHAIVDAYENFASGSRRDTGGDQRAALLRALRHLANRNDIALLEVALMTYEFMPRPVEVASGLRTAALVTLNEIDEKLAGYHAARLLVDRYTSPMSGEPAVTAVRVLASQGQELPLYAYAVRDEPGVPEVVGESLRYLTSLPVSLLSPLVERYLKSEDEIVLLGLFDLLLTHDAHASFVEVVLEFLRTTRLYNIFRYLATTIVAGHHDELIDPLKAMATAEQDLRKAEILQEALALATRR